MTTSKKPALLVLAAGLGSRYQGLKQFEPMGPGGNTLLEYSIFDALRAGFQRIVLVVQAEHQEILEKNLRPRLKSSIDLRFVHQHLSDLPAGLQAPATRKKPWGTLHAVLSARHVIDEPFAVINADDYYGAKAYLAVARFFERRPSPGDQKDHYCMVGYPLGQTLSAHGGVNRGRCVQRSGLLLSVEEVVNIKPESDGRCRGTDLLGQAVDFDPKEPISMNFWGFTPSVFAYMTEYLDEFLQVRAGDPSAEAYIPSAVNQLVTDGRADCEILHSGDAWFGVTFAKDRAEMQGRLQALVEQGVYPEKLWH